MLSVNCFGCQADLLSLSVTGNVYSFFFLLQKKKISLISDALAPKFKVTSWDGCGSLKCNLFVPDDWYYFLILSFKKIKFDSLLYAMINIFIMILHHLLRCLMWATLPSFLLASRILLKWIIVALNLCFGLE